MIATSVAHSSESESSSTSLKQWIVAIIVFAAVVVALWLPYGINFAGWGDEWAELTTADAGIPPIRETLRAFVHIPSVVSHALTPDSFVGMNLVLALMTFGRGLVTYALLRRLVPQYSALALVAGCLAIIYPGDLAFFMLVSVSITTALVFFLTAILLLVHYWQNPRWYILVLMWATLAFSVGIYEVSYPLIVFVPILLIYLNKTLNKRVIRVALFWYLVPLVYVILVFLAKSSNSITATYQLSIVNTNNSFAAIVSGFVELYIRVFGGAWQTTTSLMPQGLSDPRTWLIIILAILIGIVIRYHQPADIPAFSLKSSLLLIVGAACALALGYSLYTVTNLRGNFYRTLFYSLPFASVIVATVILIMIRLGRITRYVFALAFVIIAVSYFIQSNRLSAILITVIALGFIVKPVWRYSLIGACVISIGVASAIGFHQSQPFVDLVKHQYQLVSAFVEKVPAVKSNTLILWIAPRDSQKEFETVLYRWDILESILRFIYKKADIEAQICVPDGVAVGVYNRTCVLERDAVVMTYPFLGSQRQSQWTYDRVIAFTYEADKGAVILPQLPSEWMQDGGGSTYNPDQLIDHTAPVPYRLQTVWDGNP